MTHESFLLASQMKVEGTLALERTFTSQHLDFFDMLSSVVKTVGASGQANYNVGNAAQDAVIDDAVAAADTTGVALMLPPASMRPSSPNVTAAAVSETVFSAIFCHVCDTNKATVINAIAMTTGVQFAEVVGSSNPESAINFIAKVLIHQPARLISVDASRINDSRGSILGPELDSLIPIEPRNWIAARSRLTVSKGGEASDEFGVDDGDDNKGIDSDSSDSTQVVSIRIDTIGSRGMSGSVKDLSIELAPVPIPSLLDTLRLFEHSRCAIDSSEDQRDMADALQRLSSRPLTAEARDWLSYATRRPAIGRDRKDRYTPNQAVTVPRRGHVFQSSPSLRRIEYQFVPSRPDERNSWAQLRRGLELDYGNAAALAAIDPSAFVVCLDDESPNSAGERHMQFLNGHQHPFANRWLDKPVQFAITANGLSVGIYEHAKLDDIDADHAGRWTTNIPRPRTSVSSAPCDHRASPEAIARLTVFLPRHLVDGIIRPASEIVALATFAGAVSTRSRQFRRRNLGAYSGAISVAASGRGSVSYKYAVLGVLSPEERGESRPSTCSFQLPGLGCHPPRQSRPGRQDRLYDR
ncbi:hypothetical protein DL766_004800 [Monosporascus sp. MC13-8B]|uniref:Choline/carnitine acyltransferase domain-containing protein n=1 Tax=Monosporascus cannonballus TaxID=155416 RepID=A0ABY0GZY0_9PEZI|nr:hypothetical protein DL762_007323 [Monosporascus cannonballus]RYP30618.1 hypothetical protein DL766_004800 [Monosporascus sp. MC13-8B]